MSKGIRVKRYFATGLVVIAPVALTAFALAWVFNVLDSILGRPLQAALGRDIPGLGLILLAAFVFVIGWVVHQAAGRQLLHWWNTALLRFPLTGRIYNTVSQIIQTVVGNQKKIFSRAVLIPYPTDRSWAVAFVTNESPVIMTKSIGEPCLNVFVPTTPNPTSGFLLIVPVSSIHPIDMDVEEATKLVISAGAVMPRDHVTGGRNRGRGLDLETLLRHSGDQNIEDLGTPPDRGSQ